MKAIVWLAVVLAVSSLAAFDAGLRNEITAWGRIWPHDDTNDTFAYGHWKPEVSLDLFTAANGVSLDSEVSARLWVSHWAGEHSGNDGDSDAEFYRAWLRCTGDFWEARVGLQKLNFGPAQLLRSLQWFDQLDPRDPQQSTSGVWAALGRAYFSNNASLWAWTVLGENEQRGVLALDSQDETPEWGGRFEHPIIDGTLGATYHHRETQPLFAGHDGECDSYAIDGRWDWQFGFWSELAAHRYSSAPMPEWLQSCTVGGDYTIGVGNGIYVIAEAMLAYSGEDFFDHEIQQKLLAASANYSLGMLDDVTAIVTWDIENEQWMRYASWRRTYDYVTLVASVNWNPDEPVVGAPTAENGLFFQLMGSVDF